MRVRFNPKAHYRVKVPFDVYIISDDEINGHFKEETFGCTLFDDDWFGSAGISASIWKLANKRERQASILHEYLHIRLQHQFRKSSLAQHEREVRRHLPKWARKALVSLNRKWWNKKRVKEKMET